MVGKQRSQKNKRVIVNTRPFESLYLFALMKYFLVTLDRRYFWGSSKVVCLYFKSPKARVMVQEVFSSATSCYHKHISRWHVSGEILPKSRRQFSVLETPDSSPLKWQHSQACVRSTFSGCTDSNKIINQNILQPTATLCDFRHQDAFVSAVTVLMDVQNQRTHLTSTQRILDRESLLPQICFNVGVRLQSLFPFWYEIPSNSAFML